MSTSCLLVNNYLYKTNSFKLGYLLISCCTTKLRNKILAESSIPQVQTIYSTTSWNLLSYRNTISNYIDLISLPIPIRTPIQSAIKDLLGDILFIQESKEDDYKFEIEYIVYILQQPATLQLLTSLWYLIRQNTRLLNKIYLRLLYIWASPIQPALLQYQLNTTLLYQTILQQALKELYI